MLITVTCPFCGKRSKINAEKQGRKLRCPYAECRQSFTVPAGEPMEAPAPEVEVVEQPSAPSWQAAPPPVRQAEPPGQAAWAPPLARVEESYDPFAPAPAPETVEAVYAEPVPIVKVTDLYAPVVRHRSKTMLLMFVGVLILGVASALIVPLILRQLTKEEENRRDTAVQKFEQGNYGEAERLFEALIKDYDSSDRRPSWEFMRDLSHVCSQAGGSAPNVVEVLKRVNTLVKTPRVPDLLKAHRGDTWDATMRLGIAAVSEAERQSDPKMIDDQADKFLKLARDVGPGTKYEKDSEKRYAELQNRMAQARVKIAAALAKKEALKNLDELAAREEPQIVEEAELVHDYAGKMNPSLKTDAELLARIAALKKREPGLIRYYREGKELPRGGASGAGASGLVVCPVIAGSPGPTRADDGIAFALARGVLYALSQKSGEPRWFMRVGIDSQTLPVRLPADPSLPEMALVFSTETNTLSAVEVQTGKTAWHFQMAAPCTAAPVLVGRRAFVPTTDGKLHDIDTSAGRLEGRFEMGQPLTLPGTFDAGSQRLFVPADKKRLYILDVAQKTCETVFYSNHPVGGLRAPPIVVTTAEHGRTLVLIEATDLQTTKVRGFTLPKPGADSKLTESIDYAVTGWSWFPPFFDGETLGFVTDRGVLALFGVNRGTSDRALFALADRLADGRWGLIVDNAAYTSGRPFGRAQVLDSHLNDWWLLIGGQLRRFRFDSYRRQLTAIPGPALALGTPLHDRQPFFRDRQIVLVSQENDHRCVVTSIDSVRGALQWQRQLGLTSGQTPLSIGQQLLVMDQAGGLLLLDPSKAGSEKPGVTAGDWVANGLDPSSPPLLLRSPDGRFAVALIYLSATDQMVVRRIEAGKGVIERVFPLLNAPAGLPAVTADSILVPCRDGNFYELLLDGPPEASIGLVWRDRNAPPGAAGHALAIAPDQVLISDGAQTLTRWQRSGEGGRQWRRLQGGIDLPARLALPPLMVTTGDGDRFLCVADEAGTVHLRPLSKPGGEQKWPLGDLLKNENPGQAADILRGPFACGSRIGVIVHPGRLVLLDPKASAPAWEFAAGKGGVSGEPQLVDGYVLVAELSGQFVWLDAAKGEPKHKASQIEAVPAAAAVPFGPRQALAPLADGTLMLLPVPR